MFTKQLDQGFCVESVLIKDDDTHPFQIASHRWLDPVNLVDDQENRQGGGPIDAQQTSCCDRRWQAV